MKCPFCAEEMKNGFINSRMDITFTHSEIERGEDPTTRDDYIFLPEESRFEEENKPAYYCADCERVVIKPKT